MSPVRQPYFGITTQQAETALARWLLPHRLADLEGRLDPSADRYSKLGISLIIRSLLIDGQNIESLARNRGEITPPIFSYTPYKPQEGPVRDGLHWVENGVPTLIFATTTSAFTSPTVQSDLKGFLKAPVAQIESTPVSVQEFVKAYAHVLGGVHLGRPDSDAQKLLHAASAAISQAVNGWSAALQHIGVVTLRALKPIAETPAF